MDNEQHYTREEWYAEAVRRFGDSSKDWKFKCPACGYVASTREWILFGAPREEIAVSCVGRWMRPSECQDAFSDGPGPCNYAGYGLIRINPVRVHAEGTVHQVFDFAEGNPTCESCGKQSLQVE